MRAQEEGSDFKDYIGELIGEEKYPDSGGTKLTNFHSIMVKSSLKVLPRNATAAGR